MNLMCPCATREGSVNPAPHACIWVAPWQAAALVARPVQTIHTWRKRGHIDSRKDPVTDSWQVCNCEAATKGGSTYEKWRRAV